MLSHIGAWCLALALSIRWASAAYPHYYEVVPTLVDANVDGAGSAAAAGSSSEDYFLMFKTSLWVDFRRNAEPRTAQRVNLTHDIAEKLVEGADDKPHDDLLLQQIPRNWLLGVYCTPMETCEDGIVVRVTGGCPCCDVIGGRRGTMLLPEVGAVAWVVPKDVYGEFEPYARPESEFPQCGASWVSANVVEFVFLLQSDKVQLVPDKDGSADGHRRPQNSFAPDTSVII